MWKKTVTFSKGGFEYRDQSLKLKLLDHTKNQDFDERGKGKTFFFGFVNVNFSIVNVVEGFEHAFNLSK